MKKRIKIPLIKIASREDAELVMNEIATIVNSRRKIMADLDAAVLQLQNNVAAEIAECDTSLKTKSDALCAWAEAHPGEFPKDRKSITFLSGTLGFRTGTPKLALLSRAWNWEKVLDAVLKKAFTFTRTKTELDKDAVLSFAASEPDKARLEQKVLTPIGVKIVQDESFFVEPNLTDTNVKQ